MSDSDQVLLNPADRSLDCIISGSSSCQLASTVSDEGFGYLWSGVRATHGITAGRFWFSVRVLEPLETNVPNIGDSADLYSDEDATANTIHCCRIGVSKLSVDVNCLGTLNSWGYGSTGKKSTGNMYNVYPASHGRCYGPGDEVACFVDLTKQSGIPSISYAVNGEMLGQAFPLLKPPDPSDPTSALFPHILLKNLSAQVNFSGERPVHLPAGQAWDGMWDGYMPWQASLGWSQPPTPGPALKPFQQCQVIMMVGLPGSGKSHQAARLKNARQQQQQHGSRTVMHEPRGQQQQQQQEQGFMLLSPELITKQMKVQGLPRRGGVGAAAARTCELLGQAEEVFERLLGLAAQHPGNYIIDCCNVRAEARRQRLAAFREAGFRCVAGVVVERDDVIAKHMQRRDQALQPSLEDMLDLKANFTLPEVSPEEFDEVQFLGSITHPQLAAEVVAAQRQLAQQQLQQLQDGTWPFENSSSTLYNAFSSSFGVGYGGMGPASSMQSYGSSMYGPAAAADASRSWSRSSSEAFHPGGRANSTSSGGSFSSSRHNSSGLAGQAGVGAVGFTPYNPAEYMMNNRMTPAGHQLTGHHVAAGAAAPAALPYGQYSQYALPYDPSRRAGSSGQPPPFGPHHVGFGQQHSSSFGHASSLSHSSSFGQHSSNVYVRQPSWIGPQPCQGVPPSPGAAQPATSSGLSAVVTCTGNSAAAAAAGGGGSGGSTPISYQQQRQRQQQQVAKQQLGAAASQSKGWPSKGTAGKAWATPAPAAAAGTAAAAAAAIAGSSSDVVAGSSVEEFPSLTQSVTKVNSSKTGQGQQTPQQHKQLQQQQQEQQQQEKQQQQQQQQQPGVQQQRSIVAPAVVSPFAAFQPVPEGESQASWPSVDDHSKPSATTAAAAGSPSQASDSSNNAPTPQQQQQQQRHASINQSSSLNADIHSITSAGSEGDAAAAAGGGIGIGAAAAAAAAQGGSDGAVQLSPELQQQLQELQLTCLSSDVLWAAMKGQGPSGLRPRKLGKGAFGIVFGCCMSDLVPTAAASRQPTPEQSQLQLSDTGSSCETPANTPVNVSCCSANGHSSSTDATKGSSSNGTTVATSAAEEAAADGSAAAASAGAASNGNGAAAAAAADIVAVKVLPPRQCTAAEFVRELEVLARCRHEYLVALQAYCLTKRALVFEYCSHGSLEDWLAGRPAFTNGQPLLWRSRVTIARQVAAALLYLHTQAQPIVHRDVKPNNILLADDMSARLADVGLSRFLPINLTSIESSTPGCFYYMPDEYNLHGVVSAGLDVFSFGLLLANVLTGDVFTNPRRLVYRLAEQLTGFEADLLAAAAAAAAAGAGVPPRAVQQAAAGAVAAAASHLKAGVPPAGGAGGAGSNGTMQSTSSKSHWWLGVLANCSKPSSSSSSGASRSSSGAAISTPTSPVGSSGCTGKQPTSPASPSAAASPAPPAAAGKSWAAIASKPKLAPTSSRVSSTAAAARAATAKAAPAAQQHVGLRSAAAAQPDVAAATMLPDGLQELLDGDAGQWPPHVAVGLAMLALACSEPERRKRPAMKDVLAALSAMEKNTQ